MENYSEIIIKKYTSVVYIDVKLLYELKLQR
jgi:hypothetical protein